MEGGAALAAAAAAAAAVAEAEEMASLLNAVAAMGTVKIVDSRKTYVTTMTARAAAKVAAK